MDVSQKYEDAYKRTRWVLGEYLKYDISEAALDDMAVDLTRAALGMDEEHTSSRWERLKKWLSEPF
jgi:hypothetical protein